MDSISRYIFRQTAVVMIFVTIVFSLVIWLTQSLRFVDLVVNRGLPVTEFLWLAMLILPRWLAVIMPLACVLAVVYVYNRLISDRELVVLRAAGFSNLRLVRPAAALALLCGLFVYLLNIYLLPVSYRQFTDLRLAIRSDYSSILLQEGAFHTLPGPVTIFVRERGGAGLLNGILVHDGRDPDQPVTVMAESGRLVSTEAGTRVVLINASRQQVDRDSRALSFGTFEKYTIDLDLAIGAAPSGRTRNPEEMFLWELFDPALQTSPKGNSYRAEGHSRLVSPLLALVLVLASLAVLLSGDFSRRGQNDRVVMAVVLFLALEAAGIAAHNLASNDTKAIPLLYANIVLPIIASLYVLGPGAGRRHRRARRTAAAAR